MLASIAAITLSKSETYLAELAYNTLEIAKKSLPVVDSCCIEASAILGSVDLVPTKVASYAFLASAYFSEGLSVDSAPINNEDLKSVKVLLT